MMRKRLLSAREKSEIAGFTLFEALVAVALMGLIIFVIGSVTAQWLPNWHRGFARVQRTELLNLGLERLVADLSAAEFVPPSGESKQPYFEGSALSVTLVRTAIAPDVSPHLEFVRLAETVDDRGFAFVRTHAPFAPLSADAPNKANQADFADPVVLIRAPVRVSFAYAGRDRVWSDAWRSNGQLPTAIRVTLREATTNLVLAISTATLVHVNAAAACVSRKSAAECANGLPPPPAAAPAPAGQQL